MRIISQDGKIDLPYEKVELKMETYGNLDGIDGYDKHCRIRSIGLYNEGIDTIASYYSESKGKKAMEMLHDYYGVHIMYKILTEEHKVLFVEDLSDKGKVELSGVFQFPSDSELED